MARQQGEPKVPNAPGRGGKGVKREKGAPLLVPKPRPPLPTGRARTKQLCFCCNAHRDLCVKYLAKILILAPGQSGILTRALSS